MMVAASEMNESRFEVDNNLCEFLINENTKRTLLKRACCYQWCMRRERGQIASSSKHNGPNFGNIDGLSSETQLTIWIK